MTLPQVFDLTVGRRELEVRARVVWRSETQMGVVFLNVADERGKAEIVPRSYARRLSECERENAALKRRIEQLSSAE